jgi:hypothetical protein
LARYLQSLRRFFAQPQVREFLLWCLPALVVGFAIRAVLMAQLPYAIYHDDSGDLLVTSNSWLTQHRFEIHGKKTFLVPLIYLALALLHIPILLAVPLLQHLAGLVFIVMVGLLCRLWFAHWRWFILPITLLMAIDPALLWYEHLLMAETAYVFTLVLVALAGTLYVLHQSRGRFFFLCASLVLLAGSRPEGKLLFGFAFLLLVLLHWRRWRVAWVRFAILLVVAIATHFATRTGQAGLLLYTSVARITPTELKSAPGFDPYIAPVRAELQQRFDSELGFPRVADRRNVAAAVEQYLAAQNPRRRPGHEDTNDLCLKLAKETCLKNFFRLPAYFYQKFRYTTREPTYGFLDRNWVFDRQISAFHGNSRITGPKGISRRITGADTTTDEAYIAFLNQHYREIPWFNNLANAWNGAVNSIRLPDEVRVTGVRKVLIRRLPVLYLLGAAGLLMVMFRRGILQPFHIAWGLTLLGLFYVIILTANIRGRFRFGLEPFWYLYLGLIFDCLAYWVFWKHRPPAVVKAPKPAPVPA